MQEKGVRIVDLHTSGHADEATVHALVEDVRPWVIIPVHTENAKWFERFENCRIIHDSVFEL